MASSGWRVELSDAAKRDLDRLDGSVLERAAKLLRTLAKGPPYPGAKALRGHAGVYRLRSGDYRLVYEVQESVLLVHVIAFGHRRDVYATLRRRR